MMRVVAVVLTLVLAPAAALGGEEGAAPDARDWQGAARQALEQLDRALDHLEGMVERLPSYGMPYVDEDGDIVIPRHDRTPISPVPGEPDIVEI